MRNAELSKITYKVEMGVFELQEEVEVKTRAGGATYKAKLAVIDAYRQKDGEIKYVKTVFLVESNRLKLFGSKGDLVTAQLKTTKYKNENITFVLYWGLHAKDGFLIHPSITAKDLINS